MSITNQYPPTRKQYVASYRHEGAKLGGALGLAAGVATVVALAGAFTASYFTLFTIPLVVAGAGAIGAVASGMAGAAYGGMTYKRRYAKEFAQGREVAAMMAEDPQRTSATPLPPEPELTAQPSRSWASMFQRHAGAEEFSHVERLQEEQREEMLSR